MKKDKRPSVLLLDGHSLPCLAFTRSLGRAGISVTVASESPDASTRVSRHGTKFPICPSPLREPEAFRHWLFRTLSQEHFDLLVGMTDQTVFLLQEWREQLGQLVDVPLAPREAFQLAWDNAATVKLAQELGIPTPRTFFIQDWGDLERVAQSQRGPLVIRPRHSINCKDGMYCQVKVEYAFDAQMLRKKYALVHYDSPWPLIKEYVPGVGAACFFLRHQGKILARFQHQRIRETNPTGSGSCLRVSVAPDPALMEAGERLLAAMNWEGLAMVEYRVGTDGTAYLIEVNPRPWGSIQLAVEAGVDFPLLWYCAVTGQPVKEVHSHRAGVYCRYLGGDLRNLESVLHGPPPDWRLPYPKRLPTLLQFLKFWGPNLCYDDFASGDWRPGFIEILNYLVTLKRRIDGQLRRKFASRLYDRLRGAEVK